MIPCDHRHRVVINGPMAGAWQLGQTTQIPLEAKLAIINGRLLPMLPPRTSAILPAFVPWPPGS